MIPLRLFLTAAAVTAALLTATAPSLAASARHSVPRRLDSHTSAVQEVVSLRRGIDWQRSQTWRWQDVAGVARTRAAHAERRTHSVAFLGWIDRLWLRRRLAAKHYAASHSGLRATGDWATAVAFVQRDWPGSSGWLLSCSSSEGGHGIWIWNGGVPYRGPTPPAGSSGAGGWMQYMAGTFRHDYDRALYTARSSRLAVPPRSANSWLSPLGQAFAAGWAYYHDRPVGKWTGSRC